MAKSSLELKDTHLNATRAADCTLHLILGTQSLSCMVFGTDGMVLALESWEYARTPKPFNQVERDARQVLKDEPLFELPFGNKNVALFHPTVTIVPRRLFQHGTLPAYFNLIVQPAQYRYAYEELPEFDAYLVFATEKAQVDLLAEYFPKARIRHLAVPMLRYIRKMAGIAEHTVFVNLRSQLAQIAVLERQNLLFFNTAAFSTPADLVYFILLAYDQFRLNPAEVPLTLAGSIQKDSEYYQSLYRFVREMRFAIPPVQFRFPPELEHIPQHRHLDLLTLKND